MQREEFIAACRSGGKALEGAMRALDRGCSARLLRECRRSVRDRALAEELVQDAFIKAWKSCAQFRGESELYAWLRMILRRCIVDHLRHKKPAEPMDGQDGTPRTEVLAK